MSYQFSFSNPRLDRHRNMENSKSAVDAVLGQPGIELPPSGKSTSCLSGTFLIPADITASP